MGVSLIIFSEDKKRFLYVGIFFVIYFGIIWLNKYIQGLIIDDKLKEIKKRGKPPTNIFKY